MPTPSATIRLAHPRAAVWAVVSDPAQDPRWCDAVRSCELVAGEPAQVGARYRFTEGLSAKKAREGSIEVTVVEQPSRMVTVAETLDRRYEITYELVEAADGGTVLTQTSDAAFIGQTGRFGVLFTPMMQWQMRRQLRALRRLLNAA